MRSPSRKTANPAPALSEAQREEALRVARHEVRNQLTTILNAAHFLKRRVAGSAVAAEDPRVERFLFLIEKAANDAHGLLDALRDGLPLTPGRDSDALTEPPGKPDRIPSSE